MQQGATTIGQFGFVREDHSLKELGGQAFQLRLKLIPCVVSHVIVDAHGPILLDVELVLGEVLHLAVFRALHALGLQNGLGRVQWVGAGLSAVGFFAFL